MKVKDRNQCMDVCGVNSIGAVEIFETGKKCGVRLH